MSPRPRATSDADILAAAFRIVSRVGPSLTLGDVAKEAGVSPATLVQRFGSKRGLLLAVFSSGPTSLADQFAHIRASSKTALGAVVAVGDCMAAMAHSPEAMSNSLAFLQMDLVDPEFHALALAHSRSTCAEIVKLLDEAIAARELARCDTRALARTIQSLIGGSLVQWAIDRDTTVLERVREDLDTLLRPRRRIPRARRRQVRRKTARP
jgi:AcrR family transcriptional regulator